MRYRLNWYFSSLLAVLGVLTAAVPVNPLDDSDFDNAIRTFSLYRETIRVSHGLFDDNSNVSKSDLDRDTWRIRDLFEEKVPVQGPFKELAYVSMLYNATFTAFRPSFNTMRSFGNDAGTFIRMYGLEHRLCASL